MNADTLVPLLTGLGGSYEITVACLSVCLSVRLFVRLAVSLAFFSGMGHYFPLIFCTIVDNWNIEKLTELFFPGKFIFVQILTKRV